MSELARELIPIVVMYFFVFLLAPFIAVTMWVAFDGDKLREPEGEGAGASSLEQREQVSVQTGEALGAA